jgi:hypothetical protein
VIVFDVATGAEKAFAGGPLTCLGPA